jgi:hypothetical protein
VLGGQESMLTRDDDRFFDEAVALHEAKYLVGTNPRQQSGFGRDERDWERFRRPVVAPIRRSGSFLDIGCANGLLMESVVAWAAEDGHRIEPFDGIHDAVSPEHGFVITRVVSVSCRAARQSDAADEAWQDQGLAAERSVRQG